jgi:hypothetical protein
LDHVDLMEGSLLTLHQIPLQGYCHPPTPPSGSGSSAIRPLSFSSIAVQRIVWVRYRSTRRG